MEYRHPRKSTYKTVKNAERILIQGDRVARPIQYVVELNEEEAEIFLEDILNPKPNPTRDEFISWAKKLQFEVR